MKNTEIDQHFQAPADCKYLIKKLKYTKSVTFFNSEGHAELVGLHCLTVTVPGKKEAQTFVLPSLESDFRACKSYENAIKLAADQPCVL